MDDLAVSTPSLAEVPLLSDLDAEPVVVAAAAAAPAPLLGVVPLNGLSRAEAGRLSAPLDWGLVAELRRRASETITDEAEHQQRSTGRPLLSDDRLLLGRAVIRRVVADHVRTLHRGGAELWSPLQEATYVGAVEDSVFGYGRLQPLLDMPTVENIEIHGCNLAAHRAGRS